MEIAGQDLERSLDLKDPLMMELAQSLAMVDGALHIGADLELYRFGCLLDGHSVGTEDRARGARFNSAIRFTAERPGVIVVVVSSDRRVYVIQEGVEINAQCRWSPVSGCPVMPPTIEAWLTRHE
jgi:DNA integrity scanning protein DisA with diadenylate cyclase activity